MIIKLFKNYLKFLPYQFSKPINIEVTQNVWQSYIDCTVGKPLYYLYTDAFENYLISKESRNALVLGCGAGNEEIDLMKKGWNVTAIDQNKRSAEIIRARIKNLSKNFDFQHGNFPSIQMSGKYDLIMSLFSLPFGDKNDLALLFKNFNYHTASGSVLIANFFGKSHSFVKKSMAYGLDEEELFSILKDNNFKVEFYLNRKYEQLDFNGNKTKWDLLEIIAIRN